MAASLSERESVAPARRSEVHGDVGVVLEELARRFDLELQNALVPARRPDPIR